MGLREPLETTDLHFSKVEVRVMFVRRGAKPFPAITLARLSEGKMMGVDFNKEKTWVGSACRLWPA